jgi:hypothetical protein
MDNAATHEPDSPWYTMGRFGDGSHKTLYLAESPRSAVAEFLRRHPEFMDLQEDLDISIYEIQTEVVCDCLDVRTEPAATSVGMPYDRLTSSEADEETRYMECRELGAQALQAAFCGIGYPAAGATWDTWNLVLLGDANEHGRWRVSGAHVVDRPSLEAADVRVLP